MGAYSMSDAFNILFAVGAFGALVVLIRGGLKSDTFKQSAVVTLLERQHEVMSDGELDHYRAELESEADRERWDRLIPEIKAKTNGVVRFGHLFWLSRALDNVEDSQKNEIPTLEPPPGRRYRLPEDPGFIGVREFVQADLDGRDTGAAVELIKAAAASGSPIAMTHLGASLMAGKPEFGAADPDAGRRWLESAANSADGGSARWTLGFNLLEGTGVAASPRRGLALLEEAYELSPGEHGASRIAEIHHFGLHGVPVDREKAHDWAIKEAPEWRRMLAAIGVKQSRWVEHRMAVLRRVRAQTAAMSPGEIRESIRQERQK